MAPSGLGGGAITIYGQLGDGTGLVTEAPPQVSNLTDVVAIAAGGNHSLALKSDGTVWAWGYNGSGQLGDGTTTNRRTPTSIQLNGCSSNSSRHSFPSYKIRWHRLGLGV